MLIKNVFKNFMLKNLCLKIKLNIFVINLKKFITKIKFNLFYFKNTQF